MYGKEKRHWESVLKRIIGIIKFLSSQNIAFQEWSDRLYERNNGNFLKLVERVAKFEPVMENQVDRAVQRNNIVHYLSKEGHNKLLQILTKIEYRQNFTLATKI